MQQLPERFKNFVNNLFGENPSSKDDLSIQLSSQSSESAEFDRKIREMKSQQELKKEWVLFILKELKDIVVFLVALIIVLLIDFYAFRIIQKNTSSENEIRFAIAALTATVSSLISYLVGRAVK